VRGDSNSLSNDHVLTIYEDLSGILWIGTNVGLNKYDGYDITVYEVNPGDPDAMAGEIIHSLLADSQNNLWIGTNIGLVRMHLPNGETTQYRNIDQDRESITKGEVNAILEDSWGDIWIGTRWGLNRFNPESGTFTRFLPENNITDLYQDQNGLIWIASNLGLINWNPAQERFTVITADAEDPQSISSSVVTAIDGDGTGKLWVGTGYGLNYFDPSTGIFKRYLADPDDPASLSHNSVTDILHDRLGRTWVSTAEGLNLYNQPINGFQHFLKDPGDPSSLNDNFITSLFEDHSGVIWIGTTSGGLSKFSDANNRFQIFPSLAPGSSSRVDQEQDGIRASLHSTLITDVLEDRQGDLWISTLINGVFLLEHESGTFKRFIAVPGQPGTLNGFVANEIFEDQSGQLWIGTDAGLDRYIPQSQTFENIPFFINHSIESIAQDANGDLWVGSDLGLSHVFSSDDQLQLEKWRFAEDESGIITLFFDSRDTFWIGSTSGAYARFPGDEEFTHFTSDPQDPTSLEGKLVHSIFEDQQGTIWIGTIFGGLNRFDPATRTFESFNAEDGLFGEWISCIIQDELGYLWMGTNRGLTRFDPVTETFQNYDSRDGIQGGEFFSCTNTTDGKLYFGGFQGINAFYPSEIERNETPPPVVITSFNLFNQPQPFDLLQDSQLDLGYRENFISFDFAALDYNDPQSNLYAYKLEGLDDDWNQVGNLRYAAYPGLEPGEYTFRVKAANNDGVWNEDGAAVHIFIRPPFWQTVWFQGLVLLIIVGALFAGYRLQVRRLQARSQELEAEVAVRTNELRERTLEAEQRQAEIEALYRADEQLYRYLHLDQVLNALLDNALEIMDADKALLVVWDSEHITLKVNNSRNYQEATLNLLQFTPGEGWIGAVAVNGRTTVFEQKASNPVIPDLLLDNESIHSSIQVPIQLETEIFGVMSVDYQQASQITNEQLRLLEALAQRTALAIANAHLYARSQELAAMQERNRIARDLHDSVSQSLFGATMFADSAQAQIDAGQVDLAAESITKVGNAARIALGEMRLLIYELRPPVLESEGLAAALVARLETVERRAGFQLELDIQEVEGLSLEEGQQVYSIAVETLNNILKHARAEKIRVSLDQEGSRYQLQIIDDGVGFEPEKTFDSGGIGIASMHERAALFGARLEIESNPGSGTQLVLSMERQR